MNGLSGKRQWLPKPLFGPQVPKQKRSHIGKPVSKLDRRIAAEPEQPCSGPGAEHPKAINIPGAVAICNVPRPLYIDPPNRHIRHTATVGPALASKPVIINLLFLGSCLFVERCKDDAKIADFPQTATVSRATTAADIFNGPISTCGGGQNRLKVNNIGSNVQTAWIHTQTKGKEKEKRGQFRRAVGLSFGRICARTER